MSVIETTALGNARPAPTSTPHRATSKGAWMLTLESYLAIAGGLVVVRIVEPALRHRA